MGTHIVQPNQQMWVLINAVKVAPCCKCMSTGVLVLGGWGSALWEWVAWEGRAIHLLVDLELWGVIHGWVCGCDILSVQLADIGMVVGFVWWYVNVFCVCVYVICVFLCRYIVCVCMCQRAVFLCVCERVNVYMYFVCCVYVLCIMSNTVSS